MFYLWLVFVWNIFFTISLVSTCGSDLSTVLLGGKYDFIDLTLPLDNSFNLEKSSENKSKWLENVAIKIPGGTHIEAPFYEENMYVTDLPTEKRIVQLIVIDISAEVNNDSKYVLYAKDLNSSLSSEILHHMSSKFSLVVFRFGWSQYYNDSTKYFGYGKATDSINLPGLSYDISEWLTTCELCKNVVGIGTDLPSVGQGENNGSKEGFYVIEGLNLSYSLPSHQCIAIVAPMKIKQLKAPANVVAICPKNFKDHVNGVEDNKEHKREKRHGHMMEHANIMECAGMRSHQHENSNKNEEQTNVPDHIETNIKDKHNIEQQDKNQTSVNELSPHHQINKNNTKEHKDKNRTTKPESHIIVNKNVTQGNTNVNSANENLIKTGEMENKKPHLTTVPQDIIAGISNIKDKIKEYVTT